MLSSIISGLKSQVVGELTNKIGISEDKIDDVLKISGDVAKTEVTKEATSGGIGGIMNLFSGTQNNSAANGLQSNIVNGIVGKLISKLGLNESMATMAANYIVPLIMDKVTGKNSETADDDASPINDMFGLGGGEAGGLMDKVGGFFS